MATINKNYNKLQGGYLFGEVAKRIKDFKKKNPEIRVMSLGVGDTTQPLSPTVINGLKEEVKKLANVKTYTGYQDAEGKDGNTRLRNALLDLYKMRKISLKAQEVFINDGAKPALANI